MMTKPQLKQYIDCISIIDNAESASITGFGCILIRMDMVALARNLELTSVIVEQAISKAMECAT
jgi:hypothetical protein